METLTLKKNITQIRETVSSKLVKTPISSAPVTIVAASKTRPAKILRDAANFGIRDFGENYLQEALVKMNLLRDLELTWHFIGPLQSNKAKSVAEMFDWLHSVDRFSIAKRLSDKRPSFLEPLNVCLQVNICNEPGKSGCEPAYLSSLIEAVCALPRIRLRGLMIIPRAIQDRGRPETPFNAIRELFFSSKAMVEEFDTLSMGMSEDFELAIENGSTMIRLGTALFGPRNG